jgi:hypothetical protein
MAGRCLDLQRRSAAFSLRCLRLGFVRPLSAFPRPSASSLPLVPWSVVVAHAIPSAAGLSSTGRLAFELVAEQRACSAKWDADEDAASARLVAQVEVCCYISGMSKKQITNRMGLPDRIVTRAERLLSRAWMCSNCGDLTKADEPIPVPPPCAKCGRILFESVDLP